MPNTLTDTEKQLAIIVRAIDMFVTPVSAARELNGMVNVLLQSARKEAIEEIIKLGQKCTATDGLDQYIDYEKFGKLVMTTYKLQGVDSSELKSPTEE